MTGTRPVPIMVGASPVQRVGHLLPMGRSRPPHSGGPRTRRPGRTPEPARTSAPVEVAVNLKKVVTWLVIAFVVFYVIQEPQRSADLVRNAGEALGNAASSLSTFVGSLV